MPVKQMASAQRMDNRDFQHPCRQFRNIRPSRRTSTVIVDGDLRLERFDRGAASHFDLSEADLGCSLATLVERLALDADDLEWCLRWVLAEGRSLEGELEVGSGDRFDVLVQPFTASESQTPGAALTLTDVTHLKRTQEDLRRLADSIQEFPVPFIILDGDGSIMNWNRGAELVYGHTAGEMIGESYLTLVPEEARERENARLEAWRTGTVTKAATVHRIRKDGSTFPARHELSRVHHSGQTLTAVSDRDITERVEAERRRDLLVRELDHRVKNLLTVVLGILETTAAASESVDAFVPTFRDRINALAAAHRAMASGGWEGASLPDLVTRIVGPLGYHGRVRVHGDDLTLPAPVVAPLAMAIHELATNAIRHGALSSEGGHVHVQWTLQDDARVRVVWTERGGPPVQPPEDPGFGTRLIQDGIPYEIGGRTCLNFHPEGLRCEIDAPLAEEGDRSSG